MAAICVFCSSSDGIDEKYIELAGQVGTLLAERGHVLVSGGGSTSCMGAVARSARAAGGRTIGVIPRFLADLEVADHDADELVLTPDMGTRKAEMAARSDGFLILPGGLGTLEELFEMWVGQVLRVHHKPVIAVDPDDFWAPLRAQLELIADRGFASTKAVQSLLWTRSAVGAIDVVERALRDADATMGA